MQVKKAAPSFPCVIGILLPVIMLFVALGQRQRGQETACRLCCTLWPLGPLRELSWGCSPKGRLRLCGHAGRASRFL
eukprot:scaffold64141_cov68-Phaeocystis_antarctica.AAC.5